MFRVQKASAQKDSRRGFEAPRAVRHEFNSDVVAVLDLIKGKTGWRCCCNSCLVIYVKYSKAFTIEKFDWVR